MSARIVSHSWSWSHAQRSMPTSRRLPPFPRLMRIAPRSGSRSVSLSASASLIRRQARAPEDNDKAAKSRAVGIIASGARHRDDLLDGRRVWWVAQAFVARRMALMEARERGRRPAAPCAIEQWLGLHDILPSNVD